MRKLLLISFICHAAAVGFIVHEAGYRVNFTTSMPVGIYQIVPGIPFRGDFVSFNLDESNPYFQISLERHYLGLNGNKPLLKVLAGMPGDRITVSKQGISINYKLIPNSQSRIIDRHGRTLPHQLKPMTIPPAKGLALAPFSPNSFDSRYFGLVDLDRMQRVIPVLTLKPEEPAMEDNYLAEQARQIDMDLSANPGAAMEVDPDVAAHMGAFEENAISLEDAMDASFDLAEEQEKR